MSVCSDVNETQVDCPPGVIRASLFEFLLQLAFGLRTYRDTPVENTTAHKQITVSTHLDPLELKEL